MDLFIQVAQVDQYFFKYQVAGTLIINRYFINLSFKMFQFGVKIIRVIIPLLDNTA